MQETDKFKKITSSISDLKETICKNIFGYDDEIDIMLAGLFSEGHILLVGPPGIAKTLLANVIAVSSGLNYKRIQFTNDLMPSDVIGADILDIDQDGKKFFKYIKGPVFTQILLADEINRASPRVQSSLLQAMQERKVTHNGVDYPLSKPFHILATQNPYDKEGTFPLPQAQLDRFLMQIELPYPSLEAEKKVVSNYSFNKSEKKIDQIFNEKKWVETILFTDNIPVSNFINDLVIELARCFRPSKKQENDDYNLDADEITEKLTTTSDYDEFKKYVSLTMLNGTGPRASLYLLKALRSYCMIKGKLTPNIDDVKLLAPFIMEHRIKFSYLFHDLNFEFLFKRFFDLYKIENEK